MLFEPIAMNRQDLYRERLARCPQVVSDYSFTNLWGWRDAYRLSWAWEDDMVWIRQEKPEEVYWAPVGSWNDVRWPERFKSVKTGPIHLTRAPEQLKEIWERQGVPMSVREARGHWDYLYAVDDLVELKGNRYHKKKNLLNQFVGTYDYSYRELTPDFTDQALGMQAGWCVWRDCESTATLQEENRAIQKVFEDWGRIQGIMGGALFVNGLMVAYTVAEALSGDTLLIHFEKGCPDYRGVYQAMNQIFLARCRERFKTVNREQDLDDEGLRKAKLSYHPSDFNRKFDIVIHG